MTIIVLDCQVRIVYNIFVRATRFVNQYVIYVRISSYKMTVFIGEHISLKTIYPGRVFFMVMPLLRPWQMHSLLSPAPILMPHKNILGLRNARWMKILHKQNPSISSWTMRGWKISWVQMKYEDKYSQAKMTHVFVDELMHQSATGIEIGGRKIILT